MLNSIIICNAFLKRDSPALDSHNNFQKSKALFFQKIKNWRIFFFLAMGSRSLNFVFQNLWLWKFCHLDLDFDILKWHYVTFFSRAEGILSEYIEFICVISSSTKILEIINKKNSIKSKFPSFTFLKSSCYKSFFLILSFDEVSIAYYQGLSTETLWIRHLQIKTLHKFKKI